MSELWNLDEKILCMTESGVEERSPGKRLARGFQGVCEGEDTSGENTGEGWTGEGLGRESVSATVFSRAGTCTMELVNSEISMFIIYE